MAKMRGESGPGYTRGTFPSSGGGGGGGGKGKKGRGRGGFGGGAGWLGRMIDPGLLRRAMLQGLEQRELGFSEWQKSQQQERWLNEQANQRAMEGAGREEDLFRNRNLSPATARQAGLRMAGGGQSLM